MKAEKHLWFCVGSPVQVLWRQRHYRHPYPADSHSPVEDAPQIMFVYYDDELVWVHDWDQVYFQWLKHYDMVQHGPEPLEQFYDDFYRWAVSVWGR